MLSVKSLFLKLILCLPLFITSPESNATYDYILQYKELVKSEMTRTGIPASIKMAQAILESGAGKSTLATKANNHFGIKCSKSWTGDSYYIEDDDYDEKGKLKKSCFRSYTSVGESFIAHSDFLTQQKRYSFLFELGPKDYVAWAKGLKKAGYATDPSYPKKLIHLIEKYDLYLLDNLEVISSTEESNSHNRSIAMNNSSKSETKSRRSLIKKEKSTLPVAQVNTKSHAINTVNDVNYVVAQNGDTPFRIARKHKLNLEDLISHNENLNKSHQKLKDGDIVFLEKKKKSFKGKQEYHVMKSGENLMDLSIAYGVKISSLRFKNRIPKDAQVLPGEKVYLNGPIRLSKRPKFIRFSENVSSVEAEDFIF